MHRIFCVLSEATRQVLKLRCPHFEWTNLFDPTPDWKLQEAIPLIIMSCLSDNHLSIAIPLLRIWRLLKCGKCPRFYIVWDITINRDDMIAWRFAPPIEMREILIDWLILKFDHGGLPGWCPNGGWTWVDSARVPQYRTWADLVLVKTSCWRGSGSWKQMIDQA